MDINWLAACILGMAYELDPGSQSGKVEELVTALGGNRSLLIEAKSRIEQLDTNHETSRAQALRLIDEVLDALTSTTDVRER